MAIMIDMSCPIPPALSARSFDNVEYWLDEVEKYAGPNVQKLLVGNKSDLTGSRIITYEKGEKFARDKNMKFFETRYAQHSAAQQQARVDVQHTGLWFVILVLWLHFIADDVLCAVCVLVSHRDRVIYSAKVNYSVEEAFIALAMTIKES